MAALEQPEVETFMVAWGSEARFEDGPILMIQDALDESDEQDQGLGMDTYCLCREHQLVTYGGIVRWRLTESQLELELSAEAQQELRVEGGYVITHELNPARLDEVRAGMRRLRGLPPEAT